MALYNVSIVGCYSSNETREGEKEGEEENANCREAGLFLTSVRHIAEPRPTAVHCIDPPGERYAKKHDFSPLLCCLRIIPPGVYRQLPSSTLFSDMYLRSASLQTSLNAFRPAAASSFALTLHTHQYFLENNFTATASPNFTSLSLNGSTVHHLSD